MPLFTLQVVTRKSCMGGISDVGFNPQRVPACFDLIYSSAGALHLEFRVIFHAEDFAYFTRP